MIRISKPTPFSVTEEDIKMSLERLWTLCTPICYNCAVAIALQRIYDDPTILVSPEQAANEAALFARFDLDTTRWILRFDAQLADILTGSANPPSPVTLMLLPLS